MIERRIFVRPSTPTLNQQFVKAIKRRMEMGLPPDQALNSFVCDYNRGCQSVDQKINMAQLFDIFQKEEGRTIYEFADTLPIQE